MRDTKKTEYKSGVGQLNRLGQHTRPDVSFQVSVLGKMKNARSSDMSKLIKVMKKEMYICL